jgi:SAM-dependent methyltransferase
MVRDVANLFDHDGEAASANAQLAACAAAFDRAAELSPEAGVALYSLGSPRLLQATTAEIVQKMNDWMLIAAKSVLLDLGCGAGRFVAAFAPQAREVIGVDISERMVAAARRRCADLSNVTFMRTNGRDLGFCADSRIDLLYAIDSFPYIVKCGQAIVRRHFEEAARVLAPGGFFLILNYSYSRDPKKDRDELWEMADATGFRLLRASAGDFKLWDGATTLLQHAGFGD